MQDNRTLMSLFADLWRETSTLVHKEAELAKAELSEKVSQVSTGMAELAIGGAVVFAGFIVVLIALSNGLMELLPEEVAGWLAPLIIGVFVMVVGFIAILRGRTQVQPDNLAPERTMEAVRRDAQLMKEHAS